MENNKNTMHVDDDISCDSWIYFRKLLSSILIVDRL